MTLDDHTYLARFAKRDLGPEHFNHLGHLRMAWVHLQHYGFETGNACVCAGVCDLAGQFGAPEKFNHTLTEALMRIMDERMHAHPGQNFATFLKSNSDLVDDARGVLARYYSDEVLHSPQARTAWVDPDRTTIP